MSNSIFKPEKFFDLSRFKFSDIFNGVDNVWEILPKISDYLDSFFHKGVIIANYKNKKNVYIGDGTFIHEGAEILGPTIIGNNCVINHASYIRQGCLLGDNVKIGHAVEVKNSVLLNGAIVAHLNYIGDSIVGNDVNISGGAVTANFRLDKRKIKVREEGKLNNTNLSKFGGIIGDNSIIGVNSVVNPGTILGKNSVVYPLT